MITRYSGCSKRACTLINSYRAKTRLQTELRIITEVDREICNPEYSTDRQECPKYYWSGLLAAGIIAASTDTEEPTPEPLPIDPPPPHNVLKYLDELYDKQEYLELIHSMERYQDLNNAEVLWRRARAEWERLNMKGLKGTADLQEAVDLIDQALAVDETNSSAHRWKAIISNAYSGSKGMKHQIKNLETMKYHLQRAIELNPSDATVLTLMGTWHVELLELSYWERKFASTFLGELPECSYEEALGFFLKAEEIAPKAWTRNIFLIGKTYFQLGDRRKAKHYMELTLDQEAVTDDDKAVLEVAETFYRNNFILSL